MLFSDVWQGKDLATDEGSLGQRRKEGSFGRDGIENSLPMIAYIIIFVNYKIR